MPFPIILWQTSSAITLFQIVNWAMLLMCVTSSMTITLILLHGLVIDPPVFELLCGLVVDPRIAELLRGLVVDPHIAELLHGLVVDPCIAEYLHDPAHDPHIDDPLHALLVKYLQCIIGTLKTPQAYLFALVAVFVSLFFKPRWGIG